MRLSLPRLSPVSARTALAGTGWPRNELLMLTQHGREGPDGSVELGRLELPAFSLRTRRATSCAIAPGWHQSGATQT